MTSDPSAASKTTCMFASDEIIPDVVSVEPDEQLSVTYTLDSEKIVLKTPGQTLTPTQVQNRPSLSWTASDDQLYTVILTDPDAKDRKTHAYREWVHWVTINVPGTNMAAGLPFIAFAFYYFLIICLYYKSFL